MGKALKIFYSKDQLLNSKSEYVQNCLARITVNEANWERKERERREEEEEKLNLERLEKFKLEMRKTSHEETDPEDSDIELDQWKTGWLKKRKDLGTDKTEIE